MSIVWSGQMQGEGIIFVLFTIQQFQQVDLEKKKVCACLKRICYTERMDWDIEVVLAQQVLFQYLWKATVRKMNVTIF